MKISFQHVKTILRNRYLIIQMMQREFQSQYRASSLGAFWAIATPLVSLAIYALVFGYIYRGAFRPGESRLDFALTMFCGLTVFGFFSSCITRSTTLMQSYGNFVTRVVFPLEVLPVVVSGVALINMGLALVPLLVCLLIFNSKIAATAILFPIVVTPLIVMTLGLQWFVTSISVYVRDMQAIVPQLMTVLLFGSGIFYPISSTPEGIRWIMELNPIAHLAEMSREVLIYNQLPQVSSWLAMMAAAILVFHFGYVFFMKTKRMFADLL